MKKKEKKKKKMTKKKSCEDLKLQKGKKSSSSLNQNLVLLYNQFSNKEG
jgi:hypothetical protein